MIAHGHGDVRYAHYALDIYPKDSNHLVGSFPKLLRDLEKPPTSTTRELFVGSKSNELYLALLIGAEICLSSLSPPPTTREEAKPLPPILLVQLDNAVFDNKNQFMFCFWSLLVAKGIIREVYVNFMLIGHTHDNIDALFGRWSMLLKQKNYPTIPLFMKSFMDAEKIPVIPHLIEEVPDFKGFIKGFIAEGDEILEGHTKAQDCKFYVDSNGHPRMQYKIYCTDSEWLSKAGGGIKQWKEDSAEKPMLPIGNSYALVPEHMKNVDEVVKGLSGFIMHWESMAEEDTTGEYRRRYEHLIYYWGAVKSQLEVTMQPRRQLLNGFWPLTWFAPTLEDQSTTDGVVREEFARDNHFVGQQRDRPPQSFRVGLDLFEGYFLAIRPADGNAQPLWIARAKSNFNINLEEPNCVKIQYFKPIARQNAVQNTYEGWDSARGLRWKVVKVQSKEWLHSYLIMASWKSRVRKDTLECTIKILQTQLDIIHCSIADYEAEE